MAGYHQDQAGSGSGAGGRRGELGEGTYLNNEIQSCTLSTKVCLSPPVGHPYVSNTPRNSFGVTSA